jgi:hypothetical protein
LCVKSGVWFHNGFLVTNDLELQARIEAHEGYGKYIFSWRVAP